MMRKQHVKMFLVAACIFVLLGKAISHIDAWWSTTLIIVGIGEFLFIFPTAIIAWALVQTGWREE